MLVWFDNTVAPTALAASVLKRERSYFSTNLQRMQYPTLRQHDLPIGSGAVESAAKHLVQQRMKRSGCAGRTWARAPSSTCAVTCSAADPSLSLVHHLQTSVRPVAWTGRHLASACRVKQRQGRA
jgi:hypothetical protein